MTFETLKSEIENLTSKKNNLEKEVTKAQTVYETYLKQLKTEFPDIEPDGIDDAIKDLEQKQIEVQTILQKNLEDLKFYIGKIEEIVNANSI